MLVLADNHNPERGFRSHLNKHPPKRPLLLVMENNEPDCYDSPEPILRCLPSKAKLPPSADTRDELARAYSQLLSKVTSPLAHWHNRDRPLGV
jgi:hypothetical protein